MHRADGERRGGRRTAGFCAALGVVGLGVVGLGTLALGACSNVRPEVSYPVAPAPERRHDAQADEVAAAAMGGAWDGTLGGLRADDQRVANVAYRLASANVELCPDRAPLTGLVLQSALQYGPQARPKAEAFFHIDVRPSVEVVVADSPAGRAGVQAGDVLLAVGDTSLAPPPGRSDADPASNASIEAANAAIASALSAGPATLTVLRGARQVTLPIERRLGCAYDAEVLPDSRLRADANGAHVFITTALVSYARSDDALALILGHEYAHDLLHHREKLDRAGIARRELGQFGSTPGSLYLTEKEADYVGLYLMARAGYDISATPQMMRRLPSVPGDIDWSHPGIGARADALAATRDEINRKRQAGAPLAPNPAAN